MLAGQLCTLHNDNAMFADCALYAGVNETLRPLDQTELPHLLQHRQEIVSGE